MGYNQALLKDGTMRLWGVTNLNAQATTPYLGLTNLLATSAGWHYGLALSNNATVARWGQNTGAEGIDSVVALSAGAGHVLVIRTNSTGPAIRKQPVDLIKPVGTSNNMSVVASSSMPLRYQWRKDGADLSGKTNAVLSFPNLQDADNGLYQVCVSTDAGTNFSREAKVSAVHPPVITNQTPELNICRPQSAPPETFRVGVSSNGTDRVSYEWYHNGQMINAFSPSIYVTYQRTNDEGSYYVIVRNVAGSATSAVWTVKIRLRGEATGWGASNFGQTSTSRQETNFVALAAGSFHNLGLRENSTVHGWGDNTHGRASPPAGLTNVTAIAAGNAHSLALRENGAVVAWGWNDYDQTNVPPEATNIASIAAGAYHNLALRKDGAVVGWGWTNGGALQIPSDLTNVQQLAAGENLSFALLSNGTVRAWGDGVLGPVTVPEGLSNVVQIDAAYTHCLAIKADGTVVGIGADSSWGETIAPTGLSNVLQVAAGYYFSVALKNDGTVVAWGCSDLGQTNVPAALGDVKQVAAGHYHALALAYNAVLSYPVNVPQDLLLIYNTNSVDSVNVFNYYLAHRPMIVAANTLGIGIATNGYVTNDVFLPQEFNDNLAAPMQTWLAQNPTKRPHYVLLFPDIPARVNAGDPGGPCDCVCHAILPSASYQLHTMFRRNPFVMHLNMGDTNACRAYIDKLAFIGTNYSPGKAVLSASAGGYGNTNWYFDGGSYSIEASNGVHAVLPEALVVVASGGTNIARATNVAGFLCLGFYEWHTGDYAIDGSVTFVGQSSWYLIETRESFNGCRLRGAQQPPQGNFISWFSPNAFGGSAYGHTPVGAVTHVEEPGDAGVSDSYKYFGFWAAGKPFAYCAWMSRRTPNFQVVGDPFVKK
jgi:alpha-tubulin suppressor-like RCC1 family protein